jgi:hypothetical protein
MAPGGVGIWGFGWGSGRSRLEGLEFGSLGF